MADDGAQEPAGRTSSGLLARVRAFDPDGWRRFVHLYGPVVYRWCRRAGLREADAADVGQEVFRAVAGSIGGFDRGPTAGAFRGWLRALTRNKVADFFRRGPREGRAAGGGGPAGLAAVPDPAAGPDEAAAREDARALLRRAVDLVLADCRPDTRRAFLRVVVGREDPAAVAQELGVTVNAVYLAAARVKRRLRDEFAGLVDL